MHLCIVTKFRYFKDRIKAVFASYCHDVRPVVVNLLLFPVSLLLGWGPVTHIYLNKRAVDRIEGSNIGNDDLQKIANDPGLRTIFIDGSNSVDLIKANNLRNRERYYEYAHNTIPNYFSGDPVMGKYLVEEVHKSGNDPEKLAWSYAWLSHQLVDGFAHKIPHRGCEGWVNSRRILAGYYKPLEEDEPAEEFNRRIKLYIADHWLAEMLVDVLCYSREKEFFDSHATSLAVPTNGEVYHASKRILDEYQNQLGPGYVYFEPLTDVKLKAIEAYYHLIILASLDVYRAILKSYPDGEFENYVNSSPRLSRINELLDNGIDALQMMFTNPDDPWTPEKYLPEEDSGFTHSVYEYERDWRPGNYDFGRNTGIAGAIYYNRMTDQLIKFGRDFASSINTWPLVRLGISTIYNKGNGQWPIASAFIRTLINRKPADVSETMEYVASHIGLNSYEEIIPD